MLSVEVIVVNLLSVLLFCSLTKQTSVSSRAYDVVLLPFAYNVSKNLIV